MKFRKSIKPIESARPSSQAARQATVEWPVFARSGQVDW
jgi:hypothetical protein